ncbi:hypothetical protein [Nitrosomonas sp. Nm132]|uniref:hypothetical protein n=1 Tax=Nitrosomonas sp. Nm132 TaxID=1881053 RepID=UPI000884023B|nr:hypothetical protein [Nitrosomonas sp. Nm132]SDI00886.1 hypothetical protein SAMN05428952_10586 [Nitrosomonas sp. Nm132]
MEDKTSDQKRVRIVLQFLQLGFIDYIGARTLLRSGLPLQGAILASTAVEKYFKALSAVAGKPLRGHLQKKHIKQICAFVPDLFSKFNPEFLHFLERCYTLRYVDSLKPGFTLKIFARETLAELDHTIFHTELQINLKYDDGRRVLTTLRTAIQKNDSRVFADNYVLHDIAKAEFLRQPDTAYAILNHPDEGILEVEFTVYESPADGKFNRPGIWEVAAKDEPQGHRG